MPTSFVQSIDSPNRDGFKAGPNDIGSSLGKDWMGVEFLTFRVALIFSGIPVSSDAHTLTNKLEESIPGDFLGGDDRGVSDFEFAAFPGFDAFDVLREVPEDACQEPLFPGDVFFLTIEGRSCLHAKNPWCERLIGF